MLSGTLLSIHNIHTLLALARDLRQAILDGRYAAFAEAYLNQLDIEP
jgi:tRNA-guanine family transglycosylase